MVIPHDAPFQNCTNGPTPSNRRATRAPDKKSFNQYLLSHWPNSKYFHRIVPHNILYRNCTNGSAPQNKRASGALDKKCL